MHMFAARQRRMVPDHQNPQEAAREPSRNKQVPSEATLVAMREAVELTQDPERCARRNTRGRRTALYIKLRMVIGSVEMRGNSEMLIMCRAVSAQDTMVLRHLLTVSSGLTFASVLHRWVDGPDSFAAIDPQS